MLKMGKRVVDDSNDLDHQVNETILKLHKSLQHWQSWEVEYETLKDEADNLAEYTSAEAVVASKDMNLLTMIDPNS